ncbi:TMEM165/GDT1 family protein [Frankia sp. AgB1.9]|uniref:TMEM165/GDT1 family protein n=1 Tax=unclassified Frankia TaxID=2632575 RepID=UPI001932A924|nr:MULTISPECIES: TMEM165/GDT1 family protein [unclassified Frankia]MBL7490346.1 TMEM165/GDT1 family protein [Frankia sp. AgW1.1]MBL7552762.1 TMEM165/GDT1 family protein [Frankia sp. AgB1.9]MBL7625353.1 TMEM165/GDT1 family protein [Frankia sp. AgB1.8]
MSLTAALVTFGIIFLAELPDKTLVASLVLGSRFRPLHVWVGVAAAFLVHVTLAVAVGSVFTLLPHRVVDAVALALFVIGAVLVYREGNDDEAEEEAEAEQEVARAAGTDARGATTEAVPGPFGATSVARPGEPTTATDASEAGVAPAGVATAGVVTAGGKKARETPRGFWRVAATSFTVIFVAEMGDLTQISTANLAARFGSPVSVWLGAVLALWAVAALAIAGGRSLLRVIPVKVITRVAAAAFVVLAVISLVDVIRG